MFSNEKRATLMSIKIKLSFVYNIIDVMIITIPLLRLTISSDFLGDNLCNIKSGKWTAPVELDLS